MGKNNCIFKIEKVKPNLTLALSSIYINTHIHTNTGAYSSNHAEIVNDLGEERQTVLNTHTLQPFTYTILLTFMHVTQKRPVFHIYNPQTHMCTIHTHIHAST